MIDQKAYVDVGIISGCKEQAYRVLLFFGGANPDYVHLRAGMTLRDAVTLGGKILDAPGAVFGKLEALKASYVAIPVEPRYGLMKFLTEIEQGIIDSETMNSEVLPPLIEDLTRLSDLHSNVRGANGRRDVTAA